MKPNIFPAIKLTRSSCACAAHRSPQHTRDFRRPSQPTPGLLPSSLLHLPDFSGPNYGGKNDWMLWSGVGPGAAHYSLGMGSMQRTHRLEQTWQPVQQCDTLMFFQLLLDNTRAPWYITISWRIRSMFAFKFAIGKKSRYWQTNPLMSLHPQSYYRAFFSLQYLYQCGYHIHVTAPRTIHVLMHNSASLCLFVRTSLRPPRVPPGMKRNNKALTCLHLQLYCSRGEAVVFELRVTVTVHWLKGRILHIMSHLYTLS